MRLAGVGAAIALVLVCASAASAGAGKISPGFVTKTDMLCAAINAKFERALGKFPFPNFNPAKPDRKTLVLVGKHFAKGLPVHRAIPGELHALGEPAAGKAAWDDVRALAIADNAVAIQQVAAARAGNVKKFVATYHELVRLHGEITKKAIAAGFPKSTPCGDTF